MEKGCWLPGALADARSTDSRSFGSVPAMYSCQLFAPSPSASAVACGKRVFRVAKERSPPSSRMPSFKKEGDRSERGGGAVRTCLGDGTIPVGGPDAWWEGV